MQNYFNYFTEIEERFQQRRGSLLMLSTLDWSLVEVWREAGVPLEAVLRGIDDAFDKHDAKLLRAKGRVRRVNGLAWVAQSVMEAVEAMHEAPSRPTESEVERAPRESGFERERVMRFLEDNAAKLERAEVPEAAKGRIGELATRLRRIGEQDRATLEEMDRVLTLLEERLYSTLHATATEEELLELGARADRELAPYRGKMQAVQMKQVREQFLQKRLLDRYGLPRLSLFYMSHG